VAPSLSFVAVILAAAVVMAAIAVVTISEAAIYGSRRLRRSRYRATMSRMESRTPAQTVVPADANANQNQKT
jgi:hypothetical protein